MRLFGTPQATDAVAEKRVNHGRPREASSALGTQVALLPFGEWGGYGPAITRWETRMGRPAPAHSLRAPTPSGRQLNPRFVEWMMGLPDGWVTSPMIWTGTPVSPRTLQLRMLGNGVVPAQAALAVGVALTVRERMADA